MKDKLDLTIDFLKVLSDKTRLQIIDLLREGPVNSKSIQKSLNRSQSTISQQLKILIQNEIVIFERDGVKKFYQIKDPRIYSLISKINHFVSGLNQERVDLMTTVELEDIL